MAPSRRHQAVRAPARLFAAAAVTGWALLAGPQRLSVAGASPGVEPSPRILKADSLWAQGITGLGRLVCLFDTGVNGLHPALAARWRGAQPGVPPEAAWFDPVGGTGFPTDPDGHGTFAAGCMVGRSPAGDTVGVAIDVQWIAARVIGGSNFVADVRAAFAWARNPDGDPATTEDIPDVLLIPWNYGGTCDASFYADIDSLEARGVAIVYRAGSQGPGSMTIAAPADRALSPVNAFAVGAVDGNRPGLPIASFSSRGPTPCDGGALKPEVVTPGVNVRSAYGSGYSVQSGTSWAAAYAAGAAALVLQIDPSVSGGALREALMTGARDLGGAGEDNMYGMGVVDCMAASRALGGVRPMRVAMSPDETTVPPGGEVPLEVSLSNPTSLPRSGTAALWASFPGGETRLLARREVALDPLGSLSRSVTLHVPGGTPPITVDLVAAVGVASPPLLWDADTARVTIAPGVGISIAGRGAMLSDVPPGPVPGTLAGLGGTEVLALPLAERAGPAVQPPLVREVPTEPPRMTASTAGPVTPPTLLRFHLAGVGEAPQDVVLALFDLRGQRVATLWQGPLPAGPHAIPWDGRDTAGREVPAGIYFYRISTAGQSLVRKLAVVR